MLSLPDGEQRIIPMGIFQNTMLIITHMQCWVHRILRTFLVGDLSKSRLTLFVKPCSGLVVILGLSFSVILCDLFGFQHLC